MNSKITNANELLKKSNLSAKFGKLITPASFALLIIVTGVTMMVIKILSDNWK